MRWGKAGWISMTLFWSFSRMHPPCLKLHFGGTCCWATAMLQWYGHYHSMCHVPSAFSWFRGEANGHKAKYYWTVGMDAFLEPDVWVIGFNFNHVEDPIYVVSSAYLTNTECNYSDFDGFQMALGGQSQDARRCHTFGAASRWIQHFSVGS